ncbi:hypothetical protein [Hymenobacter koreensis]|uniref:Uncharacterized protein n=1 Tax=Hymenobacter koreensis TaxID=1084523 RepID=A0ABP8JHE1_9BACT
MTTLFFLPVPQATLSVARRAKPLLDHLKASWNAEVPVEPGTSPRCQLLIRQQHRATRLFWLGTAGVGGAALFAAICS